MAKDGVMPENVIGALKKFYCLSCRWQGKKTQAKEQKIRGVIILVCPVCGAILM